MMHGSGTDEAEPGDLRLAPGHRLAFILDPGGRIRQIDEAGGAGTWSKDHVGRLLGEVSAELPGADLGDLWDVRVARAQDATTSALYLDRTPGASVDTPETVSSTILPVRLPSGELQAIVVEIEDRIKVSHREAHLQASALRFRHLAESIPQMVWESDGAGNARWFSPKWVAFTGRSMSELMGRGYADLIHQDDRHVLAAARDASQGHRVVTFRLLRHDGEYRWMESHITVIRDDQGVPTQAFGTTLDVTDRRTEEEARLLSQKREMVGTLLGGIGHDFNNILSAILNNAALARHELAAGQSADLSLAEIERGTARAADLVRRVLIQGRDDVGSRCPVDVGAVTREACDLLRSGLPSTAALRIQIDAPLPPISGDATQVHQLVVNLVTNACQALDSRPGTIDVLVTTRPKRDAPPGKRAVVLRVRDDGVGMTEEVRQRVFDPYFSTKPTGQGTGLGLAAVNTIVRTHGGTVEVASAAGQGATFTVVLPVTEAA